MWKQLKSGEKVKWKKEIKGGKEEGQRQRK
jgi:hypothetical protein